MQLKSQEMKTCTGLDPLRIGTGWTKRRSGKSSGYG